MGNATNAVIAKPRKPKGPSRHYTSAEVCDALRKTKGMQTMAAKLLGCDISTMWRHVQRSPTVAQVLKEEHEKVTDMAELVLYQQIQEAAPWAVCFYLKTQGKGRGYIERQELTGADGGPIKTLSISLELSPEERQSLLALALGSLDEYVHSAGSNGSGPT
jgi:hypothetical protein